MKTNLTTQESVTTHESTYALLVRSEERECSLFETVVYSLLIVCGVISIWQFAQQPVTIPTHLGAAPQIAAATEPCDGQVRC